MIAAHYVWEYAAVFDFMFDSFADQKIIDAPPGIVGSGIEHVAPPGVGAFQIGV